jgi:hypothetical protein
MLLRSDSSFVEWDDMLLRNDRFLLSGTICCCGVTVFC